MLFLISYIYWYFKFYLKPIFIVKLISLNNFYQLILILQLLIALFLKKSYSNVLKVKNLNIVRKEDKS